VRISVISDDGQSHRETDSRHIGQSSSEIVAYVIRITPSVMDMSSPCRDYERHSKAGPLNNGLAIRLPISD